LIISKGGLIDEEDLRKLLARAGAHFNIIRLAYKGDLSGEMDKFKDYVYPRELNGKIEERINKLQQKLDAIKHL